MSAGGSGGAGVRALAVEFPRGVRTNDYWRSRYPDAVAEVRARGLAKVWSPSEKDGPEGAGRLGAFEAEMAPYLDDPFRGARLRRVLSEGESARSLSLGAARKALLAACMEPEDVELLVVCSFLPDQIGVGDAAFLARELGLRGAAWNMETACSSAVVALQVVSAMIRAGEYRNALVVVSCTYSRATDETDMLSWFSGDGAGAFLVCATPTGEGVLGCKTVHTGESCGAFFYELAFDAAGPRVRMQSREDAGRVVRDMSEPRLRECCEGALRAAGARLGDVDFFVFNTPAAWYASFCARALGIDPKRTVSTYPLYANIGPALILANLHQAAQAGNVRRGDVVLLYSIGSVSTASAALLRWGDVALGSPPPLGVTLP